MKIKTISAISRASVEVNKSWYTIEYGEERELDETDNVEQARLDLWSTVNGECDKQINDIVNMFKSR